MYYDRQSRMLPALASGAVVVLGGVLAVTLVMLSPAEGESAVGGGEEPAHVEFAEGSDIATVTLTAKAAERLDVQTDVTRAAGAGKGIVLPYAALMYDASGGTWAYTSPEPLVYERVTVTVDFIKGDRVILSEGPTAGTEVVVVGAAELWGAEFGTGH